MINNIITKRFRKELGKKPDYMTSLSGVGLIQI